MLDTSVGSPKHNLHSNTQLDPAIYMQELLYSCTGKCTYTGTGCQQTLAHRHAFMYAKHTARHTLSLNTTTNLSYACLTIHNFIYTYMNTFIVHLGGAKTFFSPTSSSPKSPWGFSLSTVCAC